MLDKTYIDTWSTREDNLNSIPYEEFLKSNTWKELKAKAKSRSNYQKCYCCGVSDVPLELHHLSYKYLDELRNVRSLCEECHEVVHILAKRKGVSVRLATRKYRKLKQSLKV